MSNAPRPFPRPTAADVVLCRFPTDLRKPQPGPKPRPAIILQVLEPSETASQAYRVRVCYATSNRARLYPHEFEITKTDHPHEYNRAGLTADTKFSVAQIVFLPYTDEWFQVPAFPMFGATPKLGELHPTTIPRLQKAYRAVRRSTPLD